MDGSGWDGTRDYGDTRAVRLAGPVAVRDLDARACAGLFN